MRRKGGDDVVSVDSFIVAAFLFDLLNKITMKFYRIIIAIVIGIPTFPIFVFAVSVMGIATMMYFIVLIWLLITYPIHKNEDKELTDAFMIFSAPIWMPIATWVEFIKTGEFND